MLADMPVNGRQLLHCCMGLAVSESAKHDISSGNYIVGTSPIWQFVAKV